MDHKKKFLGRSSLLFGLLFCLLLGFSSTTCYASISKDYLEYSFNVLNNSVNNYPNLSTSNLLYDYIKRTYLDNSTNLDNIYNTINQYLYDSNLDYLTDDNLIICITNFSPNGSYSPYMRIDYFFGDYLGIYPNIGTLQFQLYYGYFYRIYAKDSDVYYIDSYINKDRITTSNSLQTLTNGSIFSEWTAFYSLNTIYNKKYCSFVSVSDEPVVYFDNSSFILQDTSELGNYSPSEPDEPVEPDFRPWNGVIKSFYKGNSGDVREPNCQCIPNDNNQYFNFIPNYSGDNENVNYTYLDVLLEELNPYDALTLSPYNYDSVNNFSNLISIYTFENSYITDYKIYYNDLLKYMKTNTLYRLHFSYLVREGSYHLIDDYCTSCFFANQTYDSSLIIVKNIYNLTNGSYSGENGSIILSGDNSGDNNLNIIQNGIVDINQGISNLNNTLTNQPNLDNTNISSGDIERSFRF